MSHPTVEVRVGMARANEEVFTTWTKELEGTPVSVIGLCGELDASSVPAFLSDIHELISGVRSIIMDCHLLSYIDSTGLGSLLSIKQALSAKGRGMCVVGAHGLLIKILDISRANREFRCYETVDEAMAEVGSPGW